MKFIVEIPDCWMESFVKFCICYPDKIISPTAPTPNDYIKDLIVSAVENNEELANLIEESCTHDENVEHLVNVSEMVT